MRYCSITGTTAPIYTDPKFATAAGYRALVVPVDMYMQLLRGQIMQLQRMSKGAGLGASVSIEIIKPFCVGDTLEATTYLKELYTKTGRSGKMDFSLWETTLINECMSKVAVIQHAYVKGDRIPGDRNGE
jgi:acyl dehydratase